MDNIIWKYAEQVYGAELPMVVKRLVSNYEDVKKDAAHVVRAKESSLVAPLNALCQLGIATQSGDTFTIESKSLLYRLEVDVKRMTLNDGSPSVSENFFSEELGL